MSDSEPREASDAALRDTVVMKTDLDLLRSELRTDIASLKTDIARWLFVSQVALAGVILAAVKFIR